MKNFQSETLPDTAAHLGHCEAHIANARDTAGVVSPWPFSLPGLGVPHPDAHGQTRAVALGHLPVPFPMEGLQTRLSE